MRGAEMVFGLIYIYFGIRFNDHLKVKLTTTRT